MFIVNQIKLSNKKDGHDFNSCECTLSSNPWKYSGCAC